MFTRYKNKMLGCFGVLCLVAFTMTGGNTQNSLQGNGTALTLIEGNTQDAPRDERDHSLNLQKGDETALTLIEGNTQSTTSGERVPTAERTWKVFHTLQGKCKVSLPATPEHFQKKIPLQKGEGGGHLQYDVYLSSYQQKAVYMMLIAEYPPFIHEAHAEMTLEGFLNSLVIQNGFNELIFADLLTVQDHKALDFFIKSKNVVFKGRAIMSKNKLYLLAMECENSNYLENDYNRFINSFYLTK